MDFRPHMRLLRPSQWTKNLIVFAPLIFSLKFLNKGLLVRETGAFVLFCLMSSAIYVLNDVMDRSKDALHPLKRNRPLVTGQVGLRTALGMFLALSSLSLICAWVFFSRGFGEFLLGYFLLMLGYIFYLKEVFVVDVLCIALGFVLRAQAGVAAVNLPLSEWFLFTAVCLALFLGFSKRRNEVILLEDMASEHRPVLMRYRKGLLNGLIILTAAGTVLMYSLYLLSPATQHKFMNRPLVWTIPCVLLGIVRYLYLVYGKDMGGSPERILLQDKPLMLIVSCWLVLVLVLIYG